VEVDANRQLRSSDISPLESNPPLRFAKGTNRDIRPTTGQTGTRETNPVATVTQSINTRKPHADARSLHLSIPNKENPTVVFLGAGSSAAFGYPVMEGLNDEVSRATKGDDLNLLRYIRTADNQVNAESVLQAIDFIIDLSKRGIGSLFSESYVQFPKHFQLSAMPFERLLASCRSLRETIENKIFEVYQFRPGSEVNFNLYRQLFLAIASVDNLAGHHIFTTNYDRIIEELCQMKEENPLDGGDGEFYDGYALMDGFVHDPARMRYLWNPNSSFETRVSDNRIPIRLYKLHGSLDWKSGQYGVERVSTETKLIQPTTLHKRDLLVYPGSKEAPEEEPFRSLYERFERVMGRARRCFVIGYSFNDQYLNRIFRDFVNSRYGQLLVMSKNCKQTVAKNLLRTHNMDELQQYVETNRFIPISCHFGDNDWYKMTSSALRLPMAMEPITKE